MLGQRQSRWTNIGTAFGEFFVFAGVSLTIVSNLKIIKDNMTTVILYSINGLKLENSKMLH